MKKLILFFSLVLLIASCKKDDEPVIEPFVQDFIFVDNLKDGYIRLFTGYDYFNIDYEYSLENNNHRQIYFYDQNKYLTKQVNVYISDNIGNYKIDSVEFIITDYPIDREIDSQHIKDLIKQKYGTEQNRFQYKNYWITITDWIPNTGKMKIYFTKE
jgi:hypothetical protein